jgi:hypothetical protein
LEVAEAAGGGFDDMNSRANQSTRDALKKTLAQLLDRRTK